MNIDPVQRRYFHPYRGRSRTDGTHRTFDLPPGGIKWMMADQAVAVDRGYFLERGEHERVKVLPLQHGKWADDAGVMASIEQGAFSRDPRAMKALAFIEQQDAYGYVGAWDSTVGSVCKTGIQYWTSTLRWYKEFKAAERQTKRAKSERMASVARQRWSCHGRDTSVDMIRAYRDGPEQ